MAAEEQLDEITRAEDILLGALGFDGDAKIITLVCDAEGYRGTGSWPDGDSFDFSSDWTPDELELWAIEILQKALMS
jgi:hypothetical protein